MIDFSGKHVAITGGAGEIGLVIAKQFAENGATVTLVDRAPPPDFENLRSQFGFAFEEGDVTNPGSMTAAVERMGDVDIAVANAGVHRGARFLELSPADWQLMLDVNTTGVLFFCQAVARKMVKRGQGGSIVITGSWVQDVPHVDNTGYCSSKAAAAMIARCMALELAEHQIRVNVVAPGIVNAGMARRQLEVDPVFAATATAGIPTGRLQTAEQVAHAMMYVSSKMAESTTGTNLLVDGGLSLFKR